MTLMLLVKCLSKFNIENMNMMDDNCTENIRVFIRIRPMNKKEILKNNIKVVSHDVDSNTLFINKPEGKCDRMSFKFDKIFPESSSQSELYKIIASPIISKTFEGYNGTIFAYGQTGSGKTYTMANMSTDAEMNGLSPHAMTHIFRQISNMTESEVFILSVSYLEIYNEQFRDLLAPDNKSKLELREHKVSGPYVTDMKEVTVESYERLVNTFRAGNRNRIMRTTELNENSSRSHAIFTISVESNNKTTKKSTLGKLNFVDLAGSERTSRTNASGDCLREACNINLSLMVLGNVISALVDGKSSYIPYRNSKLTRLLQNSLGGNSKTAMIATISPCEIDLEETKCTLHYATRVKCIKNRTFKNVGFGQIEGLENEVRELKEKIRFLSMTENTSVCQKNKTRKIQRAKINPEKYNQEIANNQKQKHDLLEKITSIQEKLIVGGENMYYKIQFQAHMLETSQTELEELNKTNQELEDTLNLISDEKIDVEEKYANLQDEDVATSLKIETVQNLLAGAKAKYVREEHEHQREIENLCESNRLLVSQLQLARLIAEKSLSKTHQTLIHSKISLNQEVQEFQLDKIAFAGNNVKKKPRSSGRGSLSLPIKNPPKVYQSYKNQNKPKRDMQARNDTVLHVNTYEDFVMDIEK